jgi:hypothetical protein
MAETIEPLNRVIDSRDEAYVRTWFVDLELLARVHRWRSADLLRAIDERRVPGPSYILADGTRMVPGDYFALVGPPEELESLRERFETRLIAAAGAEHLTDEEREDSWAGYISGGFGVCLKDVSPESIVAKGRFITAIEQLLAAPREDDTEWVENLRAAVDRLDALEKPFALFDRDYYGGPVTRDRYVTAVRDRYLS